jgi:hypothetical protein
MNNDLISREALKKAIQNREECKECTDIDCIHCFYDIIDNAPTVMKDYDTGYQDGLEDGLNDIRPQGKWILTYNKSFECPFCHKLFYFSDNYCGYCGARMKGGEE